MNVSWNTLNVLIGIIAIAAFVLSIVVLIAQRNTEGGSRGPRGRRGETGLIGPTGDPGTSGEATGATGPPGLDGSATNTGAQGATGEAGIDGPTGPIGPTGPQSLVTGPTGPIAPLSMAIMVQDNSALETGQSLLNNVPYQAIDLPTTQINTGGYILTANSFRVPSDGIYLISWQVSTALEVPSGGGFTTLQFLISNISAGLPGTQEGQLTNRLYFDNVGSFPTTRVDPVAYTNSAALLASETYQFQVSISGVATVRTIGVVTSLNLVRLT